VITERGKPLGRLTRNTGMKRTTTKSKACALCGQPIAAARLEALPGVTTCIECAKKHPRKLDLSQVELSQASPINRNGFAPTD
jgi:RNA polymerase-binding transcription factor DksA